jgi:MFS family permease
VPFVIAIILFLEWSFSRAHGNAGPSHRAKLLIFQLTNSPFYLGLEGLCLGLPRVIFSPLGGAIVDRADRKILFVVTQTAFLLMALFLGALK